MKLGRAPARSSFVSDPLDAPRVLGRLINAGVRAARRARDAEGNVEHVRIRRAWSRPPLQPWDHPDWVLARAVAAAVIDVEEATPIGATRPDGLSLADAGADLSISAHLAASWRSKAERRLVETVTRGDMDHLSVGTGPRTGPGRSTVALGAGLPGTGS